jgi:hypothetical protein
MTNSHGRAAGATVAACLALLAASCRNDAGAANGRGADRAAARAASAAPGTTDPASMLAAPSHSAAPLGPSSAVAAGRGGDCAGPAAGPLPRLEERQLAKQQPGQYRFELKYPLFHEENERVTQKLNGHLLEQLTAVQKRFLKEAEGQDGSDPDNARWFEGKCATAYHSKSFVSVACDTMEGPGAHPNLDKFAYNFQICPDVRQLELADLCRDLPDCRKKIIELINEDFRTGEKKQTGIQFRAGPALPHGESSDPEHPVATLRTFGITPTGLRFYLFDELPHVLQAFGVIDIPIVKVRSVLRDDLARRVWPS